MPNSVDAFFAKAHETLFKPRHKPPHHGKPDPRYCCIRKQEVAYLYIYTSHVILGWPHAGARGGATAIDSL